MSDDTRPILPPFPPSYRAAGLLLHVTSLPTPYGIGDVGPVAIAWIDQLCDAGQSWWQALPLGPTGYGNSPYQSLSSFAGNVLLISPDWLIEDGLLGLADCAPPAFSPSAVDYNAAASGGSNWAANNPKLRDRVALIRIRLVHAFIPSLDCVAQPFRLRVPAASGPGL